MEKKGINMLGKLILLVLVMAAPLNAKADEIGDLKRQFAEQQKMLLKMQHRLEQLEKQQAAKQAPVSPANQKQLELLVNKMFEENKSDFVAPDWVQNITPFGDFRYRYESLGKTGNAEVTNKRRRNRIRARLGFKAKINDEWDTIFRIASGSSETPTSTNQSLGESSALGEEGQDAFASKALWLDLAYFDWHPATYPGLNVFGGKMKLPFYRVGKNELVWDSDVNPEGGAASYNWDLDDATKATLIGGAFWMAERSGDADAGYFGIQAMAKHKFDNSSHLLAGASYYDIGNIDGMAALDSVSLNGNTAEGTNYRYDFDIVEGFAEYGWKCNGMPVAVFGNYVENTAATNGNNTAYSIGFQLNKAKKPGSWQFKASYREVEPDAVFGGLSDSDFIDGGTGGKGWELGYKYQLTKNINAALTYFINDRDRRTGDDTSGGSGRQNFNRLQADLVFKF